MNVDEFTEKTEGFDPYIYLMKKTKAGRCIFLKEKSCSIYEMRPLVCRFYPFQLRNLGSDRYIFTYTDECPSIGKGSHLDEVFFEKMFREFTISMREDMKPRKG